MKLALSTWTCFELTRMLMIPKTALDTKKAPPRMLLRPTSPLLVPVEETTLAKKSGAPFPRERKGYSSNCRREPQDVGQNPLRSCKSNWKLCHLKDRIIPQATRQEVCILELESGLDCNKRFEDSLCTLLTCNQHGIWHMNTYCYNLKTCGVQCSHQY